MKERGAHTYEEIKQQPAAWEDARHAFEAMKQDVLAAWNAAEFKRVLFTGCGSTYYLSQTAASLFETETGAPASAQPGSAFLQCWLNGMASVYNPREYVTHSTVLAREIALAFPASVRVLPSNSFYFPGWQTESMAWLFGPSERVPPEELETALEGAWGIHLFESHANFKHYADGLTLDALRQLPCNLTTIIESLLD